jgi:hypothetical protein
MYRALFNHVKQYRYMRNFLGNTLYNRLVAARLQKLKINVIFIATKQGYNMFQDVSLYYCDPDYIDDIKILKSSHLSHI